MLGGGFVATVSSRGKCRILSNMAATVALAVEMGVGVTAAVTVGMSSSLPVSDPPLTLRQFHENVDIDHVQGHNRDLRTFLCASAYSLQLTVIAFNHNDNNNRTASWGSFITTIIIIY